jgi:eukaryotic-like serine/threonine-protein kinase
VIRVFTQQMHTIDEFVEAYESAHEECSRSSGQSINLLDYLPAVGSALYQEVAAELVRIDMEHSWNQGEKKRLADYRAILPDVFCSQDVLGQVAYEEYRLRALAGENVSIDQYGSQYGIPIDQLSLWIAPQSPLQHPTPGNTSDNDWSPSNSPELGQKAMSLASNVQNFPAAGDSFLGFSLEKELGRGAFSHVFLARQGELAERLVVLKIASGSSLEPQHLARLQHTNIVPIYSVHRHDNLTAVCMPFFGQRTLADLLSVIRHEPDSIRLEQNLISTFLDQHGSTQLLSATQPEQKSLAESTQKSRVLEVLVKSSYIDAVIWLVKQIAEGLSHAHERGIVHRDLKPENVLLTDEGLPMLLDFNLSEDVVVNGQTSLLVGGTLPYMSPEHLEAVAAGGQVSFQADIFSLGIIFYELLTGTRPFVDRSGSFDEVVREMISDRQAGCPPARSQNPAIPRSIEAVVRRCLAPGTEQRYGMAAELTEDLERHFRSERLVHVPDRSVSERARKWLKRHPRISSSGGVAALAGCALFFILGLWFLRGHQLARYQAENIFQAFDKQQPSLHMALGASHTDVQILHDCILSMGQALETYGVFNNENWRDNTQYKSLTKVSQNELDRRMGELLYLVARANEGVLVSAKNSADQDAALSDSLKANRLAIGLYPPESCPRALLQQQARLFDLTGSPEEAEKARLQAAGMSGENSIDQYAVIYDLHDAADYRKAKPILLALREKSPTGPVPWFLLGYVNAGLGSLHEAEGCLTTAIALEPESYLAYFHRGLCRMDLKHHEDAIVDFNRMITLRPQLACGFLNRALAQRSLGNHKEAIADLTKALDLGATQTRIFFLRSELRRRIGDINGAEADIKIGLERSPSDELSWVARGVAQLKNDPDAALADFRQALRLNPISSLALHNSVHVLADQLDQPEEALEMVDQLLLINEKDADALAGRAVLHARAENRPAATADIQQLLRLSKSPKALFQAACALSLTSQPDNSDAAKALTLLSRAVLLEPMWLLRAHTDPDLETLRKTEAYQIFAADTHKIRLMNINLNNHPNRN